MKKLEEKINIINNNENQKNKNYTKEIEQLLDMGFDKVKAVEAIEYTNGNVESAIDYLYNEPQINRNNSMDCNIGDDEPISDQEENGEDFEDITFQLKNLSIIIRLLSKEQKKRIEEILEIIQKYNFRLFQFIKENEDEFKSYLSLPIKDKDFEVYENFKKGNENFGIYNFQYKIFDPNANINSINDFTNKNDSLGNDIEEEYEVNDDNNFKGTSSHKLKEEDNKAIKRLQEFGDFNEEEAIQAYYACDKNEELAANYLFEQMNNNNINKIKKFNFDS